MPNTYTQIHLHFVFAVKNRQALIHETIRERVEKYITGIVQNFGHKLLAVYCMPDHAHLFVGFRPTQAISDFMREVKSASSAFINTEGLTKTKFNWQEGYGNKTFREECLELLQKFEIVYEEKYLFNWIELGTTPTEPH